MITSRFCKQCGNRLEIDTQYCKKCGAKTESNSSQSHSQENIQPFPIESPKSAVIALLLGIFLGLFGIHRLYVGKIGTGLLMLITLGGLGIWLLVDLIFIVTNKFEDKQGKTLRLTKHLPPFKKAMLVIATIIVWFGVFVGFLIAMVFYATSGLVDTVHNQLISLQSGDIKKAYSYTSKDFQKITSIDDFKKFLDHYPSLKNNESYFFNERRIENNIGTVKGTLTSKDGAQTPIVYRLIKEGGTWKILGIEVLPTGAGIEINHKTNGSVTNPSVHEHSLSKVFEDKNNKFSIKYLDDWEYEQPEKGIVIFSGKKGTAAYYSTVNIQTILAKKAGGKHSDVNQFLEAFKKQIAEQSSDSKILAQGRVELPKNPKRFHGEYILFTYNLKNEAFKQLQIVIFRDDESAFYTWAYTSPVKQYNTYLPIAKAMYESWSVD